MDNQLNEMLRINLKIATVNDKLVLLNIKIIEQIEYNRRIFTERRARLTQRRVIRNDNNENIFTVP